MKFQLHLLHINAPTNTSCFIDTGTTPWDFFFPQHLSFYTNKLTVDLYPLLYVFHGSTAFQTWCLFFKSEKLTHTFFFFLLFKWVVSLAQNPFFSYSPAVAKAAKISSHSPPAGLHGIENDYYSNSSTQYHSNFI